MCVHTCMYTYTEGDLVLPDPPPPVSAPHSHFLLALHLLFLQHLPGDRTETAAINYCVLLPLHVFLKAKVWKTEVDLYKAGTSTFLTPGGLLLDERGGKLEDMEHNSAAVQADGNKVLKLEHLFGFSPLHYHSGWPHHLHVRASGYRWCTEDFFLMQRKGKWEQGTAHLRWWGSRRDPHEAMLPRSPSSLPWAQQKVFCWWLRLFWSSRAPRWQGYSCPCTHSQA